MKKETTKKIGKTLIYVGTIMILLASVMAITGIGSANDEVTITYNLVHTENPMLTSINIISIPLDSDITTASELMSAIGPTCDAVNRWNPQTQAWDGWISLGYGTDFSILPYEAYEVSVTEDTTFSITGTPAEVKPINLIKPNNLPSRNYIALPYDTEITNAHELLNAIPNCDTVNRLNPETQYYEGYIDLFGGMGTNFEIRPGEGYLVTVTVDTVWTPI